MRQDPQTAAPGPPTSLAAKSSTPTPTPTPTPTSTTTPTLTPTPISTPIVVSTQPTSHIVVLTSVGHQSILTHDGVKLIFTEDGGARASSRPLHHHKAAILQHHHQQQLQQQQVTPSHSAVMTKGSVVERRHPALGSMLQKTRMKLVYTKQVGEGSGDSSVASTSTSLGSTVSIDTSDDGGEDKLEEPGAGDGGVKVERM